MTGEFIVQLLSKVTAVHPEYHIETFLESYHHIPDWEFLLEQISLSGPFKKCREIIVYCQQPEPVTVHPEDLKRQLELVRTAYEQHKHNMLIVGTVQREDEETLLQLAILTARNTLPDWIVLI